MVPHDRLPEAERDVPVPKPVPVGVPDTLVVVEPHCSGEEGGGGRIQGRAPGGRIHETCKELGNCDSATTLLCQWAVSHRWLRGVWGRSHL